MKKFVSLILALTLMMSVFTITPQAADESAYKLIYSYDFENGVLPAERYGVNLQITEDPDKTGNTVCYATHDGSFKECMIVFPVPGMKNNRKYIAKIQARAGLSNQVSINQYMLYKADNYEYNYGRNLRYTVCDVWGEVSNRYIIESKGGENLTNSRLYLTMPSAFGDIYLDNVEIYEVLTEDGYTKYQEDFAIQQKPVYTPKEIKNDNSVQQKLYVDNSVASSGNGTIDAPFKTIEEAKEYVRTINDDMKGDIYVYIREGTYYIDKTIEFTEVDSGTNGYRIFYQAYPGEDVTISGGTVISGMQPSEIPGVWSAKTDITTMRNLYVNGERAQRAKREENFPSFGPWDDTSDDWTKYDGISIPKGIITDYSQAEDMEVTLSWEWCFFVFTVESAYPMEDRDVVILDKPGFQALTEYLDYFLQYDIWGDFEIENALQFLDNPGEWFFDRKTSTVYYIPKEGENPETAEMIVPTTEKLINLKGKSLDVKCENIVFSDITFSHSAWTRTTEKGIAGSQSVEYSEYSLGHSLALTGNIPGAVSLTNAQNITIENSIVEHVDACGVELVYGCSNVEIVGNVFQDNSAAAISICGSGLQTDSRVININTKVANNIITRIAQEYSSSPAIAASWVRRASIVHNEVFDVPYTGVSLGWGWAAWPDSESCGENEFSYNNVYRCMSELTDGAMFYTLGHQPGSEAAYNFFHTPPTDGHMQRSMYNDTGTGNLYQHHNLMEATFNNVTSSCISSSDSYDWRGGMEMIRDNNFMTTQPWFAPYGTQTENHTNTVYVPRSAWPQEAREIIKIAGVEPEYIKNFDEVDGYEKFSELHVINIYTDEQDVKMPASIKKGETLTLNTMALTASGRLTEKLPGMTYTTKDTDIIRIDGNKVTGLKSGLAIVKTTYQGKEAEYHIVVDDEIVSLDIITDDCALGVGETTKFNALLKTKYWSYPYNMIENLKIESSKPHIASVSEDGTVTAVRNGNADITITVEYAGKTISKSLTVYVKPAGNMEITLEEVVPIGGDLDISLSGSDGTKIQLDDSEIFVNAIKVGGEKVTPASYGKEMAFLYNSGIIEERDQNEPITEKEFVRIASAAFARNASDFCSNPKDEPLTREKMAVIGADIIRKVYGLDDVGLPTLPYVLDRDKISPEYIADVAVAVHYELLHGSRKDTYLRPKDIATLNEAAAVVYRTIYAWETYQSNGGAYFYNYDLVRTISTQTVSTGSVEGSTSTTETLKKITNEPGLYELNIQATVAGINYTTSKRVYVYDGEPDTELLFANIGSKEGSYAFKKDNITTLTAANGDCWDPADELTYSYKNVSGDAEVSTVIHSVEAGHTSAGGGVVMRTNLNGNSVKVDYRVRPDGTLLLTWKTGEKSAYQFKSITKLSFPAEIKLVKTGDTVRGYYKQADGWHTDQASEIKIDLGEEYTAGVMLYALYTLSKNIAVAEFSDIHIGEIRDMEVAVEEIETPEIMPDEEDDTEDTVKDTVIDTAFVQKYEQIIEQNSDQNLISNPGFENERIEWQTSNATLTISEETPLRGGRCLSIASTGNSYIKRALSSLLPNQKLAISFYVKADGENVITPVITGKIDGVEVELTAEIKKAEVLENGWVKYVGYVENNNTSKLTSAEFMLKINASGKLLFDGIILVEE